MISQSDILLEYLQRGHTITPMKALQLTGSLACHSRMAELRERGYNIQCQIKSNGRTRFGEYRLVGQAELKEGIDSFNRRLEKLAEEEFLATFKHRDGL